LETDRAHGEIIVDLETNRIVAIGVEVRIYLNYEFGGGCSMSFSFSGGIKMNSY